MLSMRKIRKSTSMRAEIEWNEKLLIDLEWPNQTDCTRPFFENGLGPEANFYH